MKRLKNNWTLLLLISFNLYFIWYYHQHPDGFKTLLLIYWFQSIMIGFFTFIQLVTAPKEIVLPREPPEKDIVNTNLNGGCSGLFFLVHYGTFHLVYFVFIVIRQGGRLDYNFLKISFAVIAIAEMMEFIRKKRVEKREGANTGFIFFLPYLRIIPMHLAIIGASVLNWSDITIFLVLKTVADVGMHLLTNRLYFRGATS